MAQNPTGKALLRASLDLFRKDPQMVWLPVFAAVAATIAFAAVATPIVASLGVHGLPLLLAFGAGGIASTSAALVFQVALVFAATDRIEGRTPTVRSALAQAWGRRVAILKWAVLSAAVGTVLRLVESRFGGLFGSVLRFTGALAWGVATFFVVPVLAFEDIGPVAAVARSSSLLKSRFGVVGRGGLRFGLLFGAWALAAGSVLLIGLALAPGMPELGAPVAFVGLLCLMGVAMYAAAAGLYLRTILYRFATQQPVPDLGVDLSRVIGASTSAPLG